MSTMVGVPPGANPHPSLMVLADRIRDRRLQLGLSQEDVAERASLHRTYASGLESGRRNPTFVVLLRVARALEVPASKLIAGISID